MAFQGDGCRHEVRPAGWRCCCGQVFHVSVFQEALRAAAAEGYRLGRLTAEQAIQEAVICAYNVGAESLLDPARDNEPEGV